MSFTDDDLKRVKEDGVLLNLYDPSEKFNLDSLLARLEVAERLHKLKHFHEPRGWCDCEQCKASAEWRKAAGK